MKVGLLLTRPKAEFKKDEMISVNSRKRPWAKFAPEEHTYRNSVPGDVLVGCYLMWKYGVEVDFIKPEQISVRRLRENDLNFMLIYDLLESFHVDGKARARRLEKVLKSSKNLYPPWKYQKLIYNKCMYYKYLEKKKVKVAPTYCITKAKWNSKGHQKLVKDFIETIKNDGWKGFVAKPVYGQESKDFRKFKTLNWRPLKRYFERVMKKYPAIVLQEYIKGFDKENIEVRQYFVGNNYDYSILTTKKHVWRLRGDRGANKCKRCAAKKPVKNIKAYKLLARKALRALPPIIIKGRRLPKLLTRVDVGGGLEGKGPGVFVNEVEFVPAWYLEDQPLLIDKKIGDQIFKIMSIFLRN